MVVVIVFVVVLAAVGVFVIALFFFCLLVFGSIVGVASLSRGELFFSTNRCVAANVYVVNEIVLIAICQLITNY